MRTIRFSALAAALLLTFCFCKQNSAADSNQITTLPADSKKVDFVLADVNCWIEDGFFHATGLVDSRENTWQKCVLGLQPLGANGQALKVNGDTISGVLPHSPAIAPRGRSVFYTRWPVSSIEGGAPDSIRLAVTMGTEVDAGAILLLDNVSAFKIMVGPADSSAPQTERGWRATGTLNNFLANFPANTPALSVLLYGTDKKLWFAQPLDLNADTTLIKSSVYGALPPATTRQFGLGIEYENLPKPLQAIRIGRVEFLGYDKREESK
jgi:hypothetical protein